jgi:cell division septum initiation protein DivIVA
MERMMKVPANETSREELLQRDVYILLQENWKLKAENEELKKQLKGDGMNE